METVWKCQPSSLTLLQSPHPQTQMLSLTQLGFRVCLLHRSQNSLREVHYLTIMEASFLFSHLGRYGPQQFPNKHTQELA